MNVVNGLIKSIHGIELLEVGTPVRSVVDSKGRVRCDILRVEHPKEDVLKYFNMTEMSRSKKRNKYKRRL